MDTQNYKKYQKAKQKMLTENLGLSCFYVISIFITVIFLIVWLVFQVKLVLAIGLVLGFISLVIRWLLKCKAKEIVKSLDDETKGGA